jgi:hypothetical protein
VVRGLRSVIGALTLPQLYTTSGKNLLIWYAEQPMQNHRGPTLAKKVPMSRETVI